MVYHEKALRNYFIPVRATTHENWIYDDVTKIFNMSDKPRDTIHGHCSALCSFSFPELRSFWSGAGIESSGWFQFRVRKSRTSGSTAQSQEKNRKKSISSPEPPLLLQRPIRWTKVTEALGTRLQNNVSHSSVFMWEGQSKPDRYTTPNSC